MKNFLLTSTLLFFTLLALSQAPQRINYQAVARSSAGTVMQNQNIGIRLYVINGSPSGTVQFSEQHNIMTNDYGLFSLQIGQGTLLSGSFLAITWGLGNKWLKVEIEQSGTGVYTQLGTTELVSVPYALYAETSGSGGGSGPTGPTGNTGPTGVGGATGANGAVGSTGATGANGVNGATGPVSSSGGWGLTGNSGTVDGTNFIGTTDNVPFNIRVGNQQAGHIDSQAPNNTGFGLSSLSSITSGAQNTAMGYYALNSDTSGSQNVAVGFEALRFNKSGIANIAIGYRAMRFNTTGVQNVAVGTSALAANTTGYRNTSLGGSTLQLNTTGGGNTAVGAGSLNENVTGTNNSAYGDGSSAHNNSGDENAAHGWGALINNTVGSFNSALGSQSLVNNVNGNNNSAVGAYSGPASSSLTNTTSIGYLCNTSASNMVRIGNNSVTSIGGQVGWTTVSDARLKQNIHPSNLGLDFILKLKPVTYNYTAQGQTDFLYNGFIAQDVEKAAKELGLSFSGVDAPKNENDFYGLRYGDFSVPLVKAVQEQQLLIEQLQLQNQEIENLKARLEKVEILLQQQSEAKK